MDHPRGIPIIAHSTRPLLSEDTLLYRCGSDVETGSALSHFVCNQNAPEPYETHPTWRHNFHGTRMLQGAFNLAIEREPPTFYPQTLPLGPIRSANAWDDIPSNINYVEPFPFSASTDARHQTQQVLQGVVDDNGSIYALSHEPKRGKIRPITPFPRTHAPSHGQDAASLSHPQHVTEWYRVQWEAVGGHNPCEFIPQRIYEPSHEGDKIRYVSQAHLHAPIIFFVESSAECGIPLSDLLSRRSPRVSGGNELAFTGAPIGPSICIRVHWPGYRPRHKKLSTTDYTPKHGMIKIERLAKLVARYTNNFMNAMYTEKMQAGSDSRWKVGAGGIGVDDIILVSLHHVSKGSWQPQLGLRRGTKTSIAAGQYVQGGGKARGMI